LYLDSHPLTNTPKQQSEDAFVRNVVESGLPNPPPVEDFLFNRHCIVKFTDENGTHSVRVYADTLFEAALKGLHRLDNGLFSEGKGVFDGHSVIIEVHSEPTIHEIQISRLKQWLDSGSKNPREKLKKEEMKRLIFGERKR
jgi:hypothetical protein